MSKGIRTVVRCNKCNHELVYFRTGEKRVVQHRGEDGSVFVNLTCEKCTTVNVVPG